MCKAVVHCIDQEEIPAMRKLESESGSYEDSWNLNVLAQIIPMKKKWCPQHYKLAAVVPGLRILPLSPHSALFSNHLKLLPLLLYSIFNLSHHSTSPFRGARAQACCSWAHCSGSHKTAAKVWVRLHSHFSLLQVVDSSLEVLHWGPQPLETTPPIESSQHNCLLLQGLGRVFLYSGRSQSLF